MKTIITLIAPLSRALEAGNYNVAQLVNALQSEANNPKNAVEKESKRGFVAGGTRFKADGSISSSKELTCKVMTPTEYTWRHDSAPMEFLKFHDALVNLFKKCGEPSGEITMGLIPAHLAVWLVKFHKDYKPIVPAGQGPQPKAPQGPGDDNKPNGSHKRNGTPKVHAPATA